MKATNKMASRSIQTVPKYALVSWTLLFFFSLSFLVSNGCARKPQNPFAKNNKSILERLSLRKKQKLEESDKSEATPQMATELVFKADGHIQSLRLSPNSRRALVERSLKVDESQEDYPKAFLQNGAKAEESPFGIGVELWNIEFADSRLENFSTKRIGLLTSTLNCAAFDEKGERIFWTTQEALDTPFARIISSDSIVRGAATIDSENPLPLSLSSQTNGETIHEFVNAQTAFDASPLMNDDLTPQTRNVVLTRPLENRLFRQDANGGGSLQIDDGVKHMKTSEETKSALSVWLSPKGSWIVCRSPQDTQSNTEIEPDWALVLLKERQRVVRFPSSIKMTFDNSTSNEQIEGRIVDILDVSDEGDLVATLVEEQFSDEIQTISSDSFVDGSSRSDIKGASFAETGLSRTPRYKIVIWDLNVARTVDIKKAKKPLMALEISQIAVPAPIPRKFCKFSPAGERFAARVEPKYITIWQSANGRRIMELGEHSDVIRDFAFAPRSAKMVVGVGGQSAQIILWEIRQGVVHRTLDDVINHAASIDAVAFTGDENYVYFANNFGEIRRWNVRSK